MTYLSSLNGYVTLIKFEMVVVASVLGSIKKGDFMFSCNLKDVYFQIPIHPYSRSYLQTALEGKVCQFKPLCFGLSTTPQFFTKLLTLVLG